MARAPFQVLVYLYRITDQGQIEYVLLKRADQGFWQGIAGGGEDHETPEEAARRETYEESGLLETSELIKLDSVESVPVIGFRDSAVWGEDVYVIPQYCFGINAKNADISISREHTEYGWFSFEAASELIRYDGNRTALWELDKRLKGKGPRG